MSTEIEFSMTLSVTAQHGSVIVTQVVDFKIILLI